jgi:hypothetical protein
LPELKRNSCSLEHIAETVRSLPDAIACETNPITGTILIHYRPIAPDRFLSEIRHIGENRALFKLNTHSQAIASSNTSSAKPSGKLKRARGVTGNLLLLIGVAGVLMPIVPGTPFLLAGLALVGQNNVTVRRVAGWIQKLQMLRSWTSHG